MSDRYPRRTDLLEVNETDDGLVVYDPAHQMVHDLNPSASIIFDLCDGTRDVGAIAHFLAEAYTLDAPPLDETLVGLHELTDRKLIVWTAQEFATSLVRRALAACNDRRPLVIIDVGCRWGVSQRWDVLGDRVRIFGFDPDERECSRLQQDVDPARVEFAPVALGAVAGRRTLYVTREPGCSSLYPPDDEIVGAFDELACAVPVGTETVDVTTLDEWAGGRDVEPDFMKLDVQGAELDVLQGAERALRTVRMLKIEVELNPIYKGQPLFGDVDRFLRERGFELWDFDHLVHYSRSPAEASVQMTGTTVYDSEHLHRERRGGQLFWADAHYVRGELAAYRGTAAQLHRDAVLAAAVGLDDLAVALLEHA